jgi:hypothetical protein
MKIDWASVIVLWVVFLLTLLCLRTIRHLHTECRRQGYTQWDEFRDACVTITTEKSK